jgi:hypothetical protein
MGIGGPWQVVTLWWWLRCCLEWLTMMMIGELGCWVLKPWSLDDDWCFSAKYLLKKKRKCDHGVEHWGVIEGWLREPVKRYQGGGGLWCRPGKAARDGWWSFVFILPNQNQDQSENSKVKKQTNQKIVNWNKYKYK